MKMGGFQLLVRGEVMRAKFRKSFSKSEPMKPGKIENAKFDMQDAAHCFKRGHKIMVQVQSSWFPLVDRNPQKFVTVIRAVSPKLNRPHILPGLFQSDCESAARTELAFNGKRAVLGFHKFAADCQAQAGSLPG